MVYATFNSWGSGFGMNPDGTSSALSPLSPSGFFGSTGWGLPVLTDSPVPASDQSPTPISPHQIVTFDTIGQLIYATMGHCRVPFRYIWVKGINESGDYLTADGTITFAAALCAPIDPLEDGEVVEIYDGADRIFEALNGGITPPPGWDPVRQALLIASIATAVIYPGTEGQDPDPTITDDKGPSLVSANRGLRYIVMQDYPANPNGGGGGVLPRLSAKVKRNNPTLDNPPESEQNPPSGDAQPQYFIEVVTMQKSGPCTSVNNTIVSDTFHTGYGPFVGNEQIHDLGFEPGSLCDSAFPNGTTFTWTYAHY